MLRRSQHNEVTKKAVIVSGVVSIVVIALALVVVALNKSRESTVTETQERNVFETIPMELRVNSLIENVSLDEEQLKYNLQALGNFADTLTVEINGSETTARDHLYFEESVPIFGSELIKTTPKTLTWHLYVNPEYLQTNCATISATLAQDQSSELLSELEDTVNDLSLNSFIAQGSVSQYVSDVESFNEFTNYQYDLLNFINLCR